MVIKELLGIAMIGLISIGDDLEKGGKNG